MARRKVGVRTEVKIDFANYCYLLDGIAGIGKTTLACEIGRKLYGEDGVLLLTIGQEPKPDHLGGVLADRAKDWSELDEIVNDLVEFRNTDYKNLRIIAPDTVDEIFRLAEEEVVATYNSEVVADKRVKSIKQAYGGYQAGENKVVDLVVSTLFKLRDAGYCLFFIGHTKTKNKKDEMLDIEYESLTSNLEAKYYNAIKDKVNVVGAAYIEREMNDLETVKDAFTKKNKQVGRIASERRVIVFRDEEYAIDVKSHFVDIDAKINFDADIFINSIMTAIKKQHERYHGETSPEELESIKIKQAENKTIKEEDIQLEEPLKTSEEINDSFVDETKNKELIKKITNHYKTASDENKKNVKAILKSNNSSKLDPTLPTKVFINILNIFE